MELVLLKIFIIEEKQAVSSWTESRQIVRNCVKFTSSRVQNWGTAFDPRDSRRHQNDFVRS